MWHPSQLAWRVLDGTKRLLDALHSRQLPMFFCVHINLLENKPEGELDEVMRKIKIFLNQPTL